MDKNMFCTIDELIEELLYDPSKDVFVDELMDVLAELDEKYNHDIESEHDHIEDFDDEFECDGDCDNCKYGCVDDSYEYDNIYGDELGDDMHRAQVGFDKSLDEHDKHMENVTEKYDTVNHPYHYASHGIETIDKIEAVVDGLPAKEAALLANVIKYVDRAGMKGDAEEDLAKANAYAHRLVYGHWRKK